MSARSRLSWIVKGGDRTEGALQRLGTDLRELQHKVEDLSSAVGRIEAAIGAGLDRGDVERLETSIAAMREQLRAVTDDLGDRVGAIAQLLNSKG